MEERVQPRPHICIVKHFKYVLEVRFRSNTQHCPIGVSVNPVIVAQPTTFRRRFNLKKADWEGFSADLDSNIEEVDAIPEN